MPRLTQDQFSQIVKAVADGRGKVKNVRVGNYSVIVDILSKSGKKAYKWAFAFDEVTGDYTYRGVFRDANQPKFFGDAIRQAIKGITRA